MTNPNKNTQAEVAALSALSYEEFLPHIVASIDAGVQMAERILYRDVTVPTSEKERRVLFRSSQQNIDRRMSLVATFCRHNPDIHPDDVHRAAYAQFFKSQQR